jgi:hypothetical protein
LDDNPVKQNDFSDKLLNGLSSPKKTGLVFFTIFFQGSSFKSSFLGWMINGRVNNAKLLFPVSQDSDHSAICIQ